MLLFLLLLLLESSTLDTDTVLPTPLVSVAPSPVAEAILTLFELFEFVPRSNRSSKKAST